MTPEKFERKYRSLALFSDEGFGQRFLYLRYRTKLKGKSQVDPDINVLNAWNEKIRKLAEIELPLSSDETPEPHVITFDDDSEMLLTDVSNRNTEALNRRRDELDPFWASWNTRVLNNVIRVAGLLHALSRD